MENKIEVVKTLTAYPLLLDNLTLKNQLIDTSKSLTDNLRQQIENSNTQINNLEAQINALEQEKQLFKTQLNKQKLKSVKIGGLALLAITTIILIK